MQLASMWELCNMNMDRSYRDVMKDVIVCHTAFIVHYVVRG